MDYSAFKPHVQLKGAVIKLILHFLNTQKFLMTLPQYKCIMWVKK